jgi:hypothetical protein
MRLSLQEIDALNHAVKQYVNTDYDLRLYGSRMDDNLKGGDIDLLLLVPKEDVTQIKSIKHLLLVAIKNQLGEQRIDLSITDSQSATKDDFYSQIIKTSISLK